MIIMVKIVFQLEPFFTHTKVNMFQLESIFVQSKLKESLYGPVEALLEGAADDTWPAIRKLLRNETKTAVYEFSDALSSFEMDEDAKKNQLSNLENYATELVEGKTKEEAGKVLHRMKERYYAYTRTVI